MVLGGWHANATHYSPKPRASNRAGADYEGRWGVTPPSTRSLFWLWNFWKLGDKETGGVATHLTLLTVKVGERPIHGR